MQRADAQRKSGESPSAGAWRQPRVVTPPAGAPPQDKRCVSEAHERCIFSNDILLPVQFFPLFRQTGTIVSGGQRLLLAVLQNAIHTWMQYCHSQNRRERRHFEETEAWFWSPQRDYLCAFESICDHLKLDPQYVRRGLRDWQHATTTSEQSAPPSPQQHPGQTLRDRAQELSPLVRVLRPA